MKNTPAWLKNTATFSSWSEHGAYAWSAVKGAARKKYEGIPLLINVQLGKALKQLHSVGSRGLSYLSFYDTFVHRSGYEYWTGRVDWDPKRPQILLLDKDNRFVNTPMDNTWRMWRYLACNNTKEFVEMALEMVQRQMQQGADGIFVDNADHRMPCFGDGVHVGYSKKYRMVCASVPGVEGRVRQSEADEINPHHAGGKKSKVVLDPSILELPRHKHLYPDQDHDYAFLKLLEKVRRTVRSYGPDKVVVVNGATFSEHADAGMLESFIFSWAWPGRRYDWPEVKRGSKRWEALHRNGGRIFALSYLGRTEGSVVEDALFAYAAARLCGYLWSDYGTGKGSKCAAVRRLDLGRRLTDLKSAGSIDYAVFEGGIIAINGRARPATAKASCPKSFRNGAVRDFPDGKTYAVENGIVQLPVPGHAGRVFLKK